MRLSTFIATNKELVLQQWEKRGRTIIESTARTPSMEAMREHATEMLDAIVADLDDATQTSARQAGKGAGRVARDIGKAYSEARAELHASDHSPAGYTIEQLVAEYRALRESVLKSWAGKTASTSLSDSDDVIRFNEAIDQALAESIACFSDIATGALKGEHRRLDAIMEAIPIGIVMVDHDGCLLHANSENRRIWGDYAHPGNVSEYAEWKGWWADGSERHGLRLDAHDWPVARALAGEESPRDIVEIEPFGAPGQRRTIMLRATPIRDAEGHVAGSVAAQVDITEQVETQAALRESEAKFRTIADAMPQMIWSTRPDGYHDYFNQQWYDFTGAAVGSTDGDGWNKMFHPEDRPRAWERWRHSLATGETYEVEYRLCHRSGQYRWTLGRALPVRDESGAIIRWMGTCTDINAQKLAEEALREQTEKLQLATEAAELGLFDSNMVTGEINWNAKVREQYGVPPDQKITPATLFERMHPDDHPRMRKTIDQLFSKGGNGRYQAEYRVLTTTGDVRWIAAKGKMFRDAEGNPLRLIGTTMDITERKRAEEQMHQAVQHDNLTGLPNRALLYEYCSHILAMSARFGEPGAVLFIDLDRFKPINDTYGHDIGDKVLQEVAQRLVGCTRKIDIVCRLGGDEFIVVLPRIVSANDPATVAQHMLEAICRPIAIGTLQLNVSPSIGISLFPEHATNLEQLIRCADMAMYAAKRDGRSNFKIYSIGLRDDANGLVRLEALLEKALETNRLVLYYQPILDTRSRALIGVEALIRIPGEDGTLLGPAEFIPVAETAGLVNRIGDWVVRQACKQHQVWRDTDLPPITISINVSPMQFRQPGFISALAEAVREFSMDPACLQIEVTESAVMDDVPATMATLNQLQAMGIAIALDDFGTGYSSLSHLSNLPLNKLKIDQSFIHRMGDSGTSRSITEAIIGLGRTLNLQVVGEGIESEEEMAFLRDHGCDQVQGFLFSKPLPAGEFASWYRSYLAQ